MTLINIVSLTLLCLISTAVVVPQSVVRKGRSNPDENSYDCKNRKRNGAHHPGALIGPWTAVEACILRRTMLSIPLNALLCPMLLTHHFAASVILAAKNYTALIGSRIRTALEIALGETFRHGYHLYHLLLRHSYSHGLLLLLHHLLILHHTWLLHHILLLGLSTNSHSHWHALLVELLLLHLHLHLHLLLLRCHHFRCHHHAWLLLHSWLHHHRLHLHRLHRLLLLVHHRHLSSLRLFHYGLSVS